MNCYFCNSECEPDKQPPHNLHYYCSNCSVDNDLGHVITTYYNDHMDFAHIYVKKDGKISYHIRLQFDDYITYIGYGEFDQASQEIITVPGFPINPSNAKNKLKTYLTLL